MDTLYTILVSSHSGFRWLLLISLLLSIILSFGKSFVSKSWNKNSKGIYVIALIFAHLQFVIGMILYFVSPKVVFSAASMKEKYFRFFLIEHITLMVLAIVLITIGYSKSKLHLSFQKGQKKIFIFYSLALLLILLGIPWPWQALGSGWF